MTTEQTRKDLGAPPYFHTTRTDGLRAITSAVVGLALILYAFRDAAPTLLQQILTTGGVQSIWYVPDLLGVVCLALFARESPELTIFIVPAWIFYAIMGYQVTDSSTAVGAGFKMILPLFCGFLLTKSVLKRRSINLALIFILFISCIGVAYSYFYTIPWSGDAFEAIDGTKAAKSTMYMYGQTRPSGFAADAHAAAFPILALCMLAFAIKRSIFRFVLLLPAALIAIFITTSRSTLLAALIYVGLLIFMPKENTSRRSIVLRLSLMTSLILMIIPLGIIIYFSNVDTNSVSYELRSLYARAQDSWIRPFEVMDTLSPFAYIHGYGLGAAGFPLLKSDLSSYFSPVDNFFLYNYLIFGVPYFMVYFIVAWVALKERDQYKYVLLTVTSMFGHFILGYGSSLFLIVYGYSINGLVTHFRLPHAGRSTQQRSFAHPLVRPYTIQ